MTEFCEQYGPWAIVTGAAQGVGLAYTEECLARGLGVVMVDRNDEVRNVAAGLDGDTRAVVVDVTRPDWTAVVDEAVADLEIGLAIANAGVSFVKNFLDMTAEERARTIAVNATAVADMAAWAIPPMVARGRGGFVVTSSGSALAGVGGVGLYSATKAFTVNLVEAIGWEIRDTGVHTLAVVAPSMETPTFVGHEPSEDALASMVDPRSVVGRALDDLPRGGRWLPDAGLEFVVTVPRAERVDMMSRATVAMYPHIFGPT